MNNYHIEEAINKAYEGFMALDEADRNPLNLMLVSRRQAPQTAKHVLDVLNNSPYLLYLNNVDGHLLIDSLNAAISEVIANEVRTRYTEEVQKALAEEAKMQALRQKILS